MQFFSVVFLVQEYFSVVARIERLAAAVETYEYYLAEGGIA